ncbi:cytochrome P450 3A29 [Biomphalaria pfeifferi]|uniref:Cytochrome P450 3A29 n=1 Tax=Biomphalaria pfeifferi TaxID=112525 RepID=A0AAD8BQR4_BIOPF|nr:cytochrome P450 3A29 [Biomphalaria pfeifferi]
MVKQKCLNLSSSPGPITVQTVTQITPWYVVRSIFSLKKSTIPSKMCHIDLQIQFAESFEREYKNVSGNTATEKWEHLKSNIQKTSLDIFGHPWTSLDIPGHLWTSLDIFGHPWTSLDIPGHLWTSLDIFGHPWTSLDIPGHLWTSLDIFGLPWTSLEERLQNEMIGLTLNQLV